MKLLLLLLLLLCMAACGSSEPGPSTPTVPIVLGAIYSTAGDQAELDVPSFQGAELAVAQANQRGGLLGRPLILQRGDALSTAPGAAAAARSLNGVSLLFGLSDTDLVLAAAPVAASTGRLFVTSGATSPLLPGQVPGTVLACFGDNVQAAAGAEYAYNTLGARRVALVYNSSASYTRLLSGYFRSRLTGLGGTITQTVPFTDPTTLQFDVSVDLVYLAALPQDVVPGLAQLRTLGYAGPVMGGDAYDAPELTAQEEGAIYTTHADLESDQPQVKAFVAAYRNLYGTGPNAFSALGYDTVNLILAAMQQAGTDRLTSLGLTSFRGVTGDFTYPENSPGVPTKTVTIIAVQNGRAQVATRLVPAVVPAPDTPEESGP